MGPPETIGLVHLDAGATRLHHPNIVPVLSCGRHDGAEFLVSEFVKGENLREHLEGGPLPVLTAAEVVETLARAVHEAHRLGFRHGDLTAARVLLAPSHPPRFVDPDLGHLCEENGRELIPRITGFGMAGVPGAGQALGLAGRGGRLRARVDPVRAAHRPAAAGCGVDRSGSRLAERTESEGAEGPRGDLPGLPRTRPRPPPRRRRAAGRRTPSVPRHVRHPVPVQPMLQGDQIQEAAPGRDDGRPLPPLRGAIAGGTLGGKGPPRHRLPSRTERHEPAPAPPLPETRHEPTPSSTPEPGRRSPSRPADPPAAPDASNGPDRGWDSTFALPGPPAAGRPPRCRPSTPRSTPSGIAGRGAADRRWLRPPERTGPGRDGSGLQGEAREAEADRRPEDGLHAPAGRLAGAWCGSRPRPRRSPGCITPISSRSSRSVSRTDRPTSPSNS